MSDRSTWWDDLDAELEAAGATEAPDPWASSVPDTPGLTPDQAAFLIGLEDQPAVPRLAGLSDEIAADPDEISGDPGHATGSPPGDTPPGNS